MFNKFIDIYTEDFLVYHYNGWYWIINPLTREWIINVSDSGYTFFNRDFWIMYSKFFPSKDLTDDIKNWVIYKLGLPVDKHCYPDYIPMDYDWRNEFGRQQIIDVMNKGELVYGT